jgi:hypothetical protein
MERIMPKTYGTIVPLAHSQDAQKGRRLSKLERKMDQYGAKTRFQYRLFRIRAAWRKVLSVIGPRAVRALAQRKRYPQIVSLGMNCEVAFRFYCRWGFVDSSVFAWAASRNIATIISALRNLPSVYSGAFTMNERSHMWMNADCGIDFHGNLKWTIGSPTPRREALDADLADLRGRLRHLSEKLIRYLRNNEATLLVHKISDEDAAADDLAARLDALEDTIAGMGANNWRLLVICRHADMSKMPTPSPMRIYRSVREFNPGSKVTWPELGDPVGWDALFSEFAPKTILPKTHAFKFE